MRDQTKEVKMIYDAQTQSIQALVKFEFDNNCLRKSSLKLLLETAFPSLSFFGFFDQTSWSKTHIKKGGKHVNINTEQKNSRSK